MKFSLESMIKKACGVVKKRIYNTSIAVIENSIYYYALNNINRLYEPKDNSMLLVPIFLPIATYVTCDGFSRLFFNKPIYKLENLFEERQIRKNELENNKKI